jgi:hypothetical protein
MGEVIDARPDRFLREIREHGDWQRACDNSGIPPVELEDLAKANIEFDRSQVECHLEYLEETLAAQARKHLEQARTVAYAALKTRHPDG